MSHNVVAKERYLSSTFHSKLIDVNLASIEATHRSPIKTLLNYFAKFRVNSYVRLLF